ncbi:MAG: YheU family protein [Deferrisomatales bacterium]
MVIPHRQLTADALRGVIEEFVTREGTDYGGACVGLGDKVRQVREQLDGGDAVLVYDRETGSCNIVPA